ncbi:hypothetical protein [Shewanella baltica]|uniref:hypothetical protein n=1 Tax=Shewanella baltica TaxID=62322 RepID=UPI003D799B1F
MLSDDLEKRSAYANFLFEIQLGNREFYYTDCPFDLEFEGQVYSHLNIVKKIDNSKETSKLDNKGIKLTLVGLDEVITKRFIDSDVLGSEITVLIAFREGGRITSTYVYSTGYIDKAKFKSSDKSTDLIIETASKFKNIKSKASSRTNNSEQQSRYPNDNFFKYAAQTDMEVNWSKDK